MNILVVSVKSINFVSLQEWKSIENIDLFIEASVSPNRISNLRVKALSIPIFPRVGKTL
jgi:hypothetical protein